MRSQQEIIQQVDIYKEKLYVAIQEKESYQNYICPDIDLVIFSLVDKLEALLWVLELDLPEGDIIDALTGFTH